MRICNSQDKILQLADVDPTALVCAWQSAKPAFPCHVLDRDISVCWHGFIEQGEYVVQHIPFPGEWPKAGLLAYSDVRKKGGRVLALSEIEIHRGFPRHHRSQVDPPGRGGSRGLGVGEVKSRAALQLAGAVPGARVWVSRSPWPLSKS